MDNSDYVNFVSVSKICLLAAQFISSVHPITGGGVFYACPTAKYGNPRAQLYADEKGIQIRIEESFNEVIFQMFLSVFILKY